MKYHINNVHKSFEELLVLDGVTIDFLKHQTTCILGPSGCGKTTLLKIMAGIQGKDSGEVVGFEEEEISFVFQEDRLIEWKSVEENIGFVLEGKMSKNEIETTIDTYLKLVNLEEYKYYYPRKLSGGMRQRISILRAFVYPSKILLMDEPFQSLDIKNKQIVIDFFKELQGKDNKTSILITHNIEEAIQLGDIIVILSDKPSRVVKVIENDKREENREILKREVEDVLSLKNKKDEEVGKNG